MAERSVVARLSANVTGYVNNIKAAERATVDFSRNAISYGERHQAQLNELSNKAAILGAGMLALGGFAVKSAMDWETAWAGVTKTIDGTPEQLAAIEQGLQDMSAVKPTSAIELAAIAESAGALGVKTEDILSFTSVMADLGEATDLTSDQAATSIAQLMNVMQTAPEDVDNLGAALVDLGNKGASTETQIIQMAQNIAGAGAIVGLSEANVMALGNALASSGIEAEAGGSAISNVLIDIDKAVKTGSPALEKWAAVAGMSADTFAQKWKSAPADALATFVEGLGAMNDRGEDVFSTLDGLGQSDIRVTRALLNMAASGDMLRESLANGDKAWEQNTALAEEAAKRYDTTAAQTKMAWNEIKTAAVDAGRELLPVVSQIAGAVGDLVGVFSSLPGPVKTGLTSITLIGGVGLVAAAGVMRLVTSIAATRTALATLGATRTTTALAGVGKAAGIATVALAGLSVAYDLLDTDSAASVSQYTKAILELGDGSQRVDQMMSNQKGLVSQAKGLSDLSAAIKEADPGAFNDKMASVFSVGGLLDNSPYKDAKEDIHAYDQALVSLVSSGATEQAALGAKHFAEEAEKVGKNGKDVKDLLPGYTDALTDLDVQQKLAGKSTDGLAGSMQELTPMTDEAAAALKEAQDATRESAMSFLDFADGIDDAKTSLQEWLDGLEEMGEAQDNWADNVIKAMARGVDDGVIAKFEEMGPAGARMLDELVNGSQKSIDRLNEIYGGAGEAAERLTHIKDELGGEVVTSFVVDGVNVAADKVEGLAAKYNLTPDEVRTIMEALDYSSKDIKKVLDGLELVDGKVVTSKVKAETDAARTALKAVQDALDAINPFKQVTIKTVRTGDEAGKEARAHAYGGAIYGPGTGTSDDIPALLSNGEHVLTAAEVVKMGGQDAVYRFRQQLNSGNIMAYATGGAVTPDQARYERFQELERSSKLDLAQQEKKIRDIQRSLKAHETVGKGKNKHKRLVLRGLDRNVAELELAEAKSQLAKMKADNVALKSYGTSSQEKRRYEDAQAADEQAEADRDAADEAAQAAEDAAIAKAKAVTSATDDIRGNVNIGNLTSPAAVDRYVARMITDITGFTDVLGRLKAKGAAPWLLQQMMKLGPSKSVIRLGEKYLADDAALTALNSKVAILDEVSGTYGRVVTDERFMAAGAYAPEGISRELSVKIEALDVTKVSAEIERRVVHTITSLAQGGGL